jgi:hypothetical protein
MKNWDFTFWVCLILAFLIWVFVDSEKRRFEFLTDCAAAGGATIGTRTGHYCTRAENIIELGTIIKRNALKANEVKK